MGWIAFLILGLIAGVLAKLIVPGEQGGGFFATLFLGVVGALLGGWLGSIIFDADLENFWSLQTWVLAIGGSVLLLVIWGAMFGRKRA